MKEKKQWKGVSPSLRAPFIQDQRFHEKWIWANVSAVTRMFLVFWFLHFSPIESWKLQLNPLRIGSKRFQILLMLVIFISNWTRSIICLSKKKTSTFLVFLQRARTTKCKMQGRQVLFWNWNVGNTQKSCFSFKRGKRGRWRMHLFPLFTRQYSAAEID